MTTPGLEELLGRAEAALEVGRAEEAERAARGALGADPSSEAAHGLLARALLQQGRHEEALRAAEEGLAVAPDSEWLHRLRAVQLQALGQLPEALAATDEAVRLAPDLAQVHHARSLVLEAMKKVPEARAAAERAIELDPERAGSHAQLGDLWLDADPARAERHYRESLTLDPESPRALNNLGYALSKLKRHREAALAFRSAVLLDPSMEIAKKNARSAISRATGGWALLAGAIAVTQGAKWLNRLTRHSADWGWLRGWAVGIGVAGLAATLGTWAWRRTAGLRRLAATEPLLYGIHQRLEADRRSRPSRLAFWRRG
jgi:tetratricopeptide (TPR) repeat protein